MDDSLVIKAVYTGPERVGQELEEFCDQSRILSLRSSDWQGEIGRLPAADLSKYLSTFGYRASTPDTWLEEAPKGADWPKLSLGDVNGHFEAHGHTWYNLLCHLKVDRVAASHWRVPRRLCQMRLLLHDPIKSELRSDYKRHFETTRFAAHGAPPGTTDVIQAWFRTLCRCINEGLFSPHLVALTLRFLEAEALFDADGRPIDRKVLKPDERASEGAASQTPSLARPEVGPGSITDDQLPDNLMTSPRLVAKDSRDAEASMQTSGNARQLPDNSTTSPRLVAEESRDAEASVQASGDARPGTTTSSEASADLQGVASTEEAAPCASADLQAVASTEEAAPCPADMALLWPQESEDKAEDAVLPQPAKDAVFAEEEDDGPMITEDL